MRRGFGGLLTLSILLLYVAGAEAQPNRPDGSVFAAGVTSVTPFGALYSTAPPSIADGSVGLPRMDANRNLQINCLNCAGAAGGTSATDKGTFTGGTSSFTPAGGAFDDVATSTLAEGQMGILRLTSFRAVHVNLRDASGNEITSIGGGTQYNQGTATTDTDTLTMAGCVRHDTPTVAAGVADGDRVVCSTDATGRKWVHVGAVDGTVTTSVSGTVAVTQSGTWTVQPGNTANTTAWLVTGTGGTFPATQSGTWNVRLQDGSGNALTSLTAGAQRAITVSVVDSSGNQVSSFGGSGGTASAFGAAFPSGASSGTAVGFSDGTNMQGARVVDADTGAGTHYVLEQNLVRRASGGPAELIGQSAMATSLPVAIASDQSAIPASQSGTWNIGTVTTVTAVTAISNALPAGTNVIGAVGNTQGSTTSGQSGPLVQGAVTTAAPTYTTAQTSPLSLQTDGSLRTAVTNTVTVGSHAVTNAGTFAVQAAQSGNWSVRAQDGSGNALTSATRGAQQALSVQVVDGSGNQVTTFGGSGGTASNYGSAFPASGTAVGFTDGTNMRGAKVFDTDSGAGTEYTLGVNLRLSGNGGSTEVSGTTPLPVAFYSGGSAVSPSTVDTDDGSIAGGQANVTLAATLGYLWDGSAWSSRQLTAAHGTNSSGGGIQLGALAAEFDDASPTAITENQFGNLRISANRNLYSTIRDAGGNERGANVNSSNQLSVSVDNTVTVASHAVTNAGTFAVQAAGTTAHDAPGSAVNPLAIGGYASAAAPSDVSADTDIVRAWHLRSGAYVVQPAYGGTLQATAASGVPKVGVTDGTGVALTSATRGAQQALSVQIVDASGNQVTAFGGSGGTASNYGSAFPASGTAIGLTDGANMRGITGSNYTGSSYAATVAQVRSVSTSGTLQSAAVANGNGTNLAADGMSSVVLTVNCASCSGGTTVNFEGTEDNTNFAALSAVQIGTNTIATTTTTAGLTYWQVPTAGLVNVRARISAYSAGTVTVTGHSVPMAWDSRVVNANLVSSTLSNQSVNVAQINGVTPLMGNGVTGTGSPRVTIASDNTAFTVNAAESGTWTVQPGNTANTTAWLVQTVPGTTNGASSCVLQSAASTNATNCKASAGLLYGYDLVNTTTTIYYLRLYNASSAPTCSSATNFIRTIPVPPAGAAGQAGGLARDIAVGETYGTGLGFCLTGGGSSTDNTNAATGVYITLHYK
jgi:hypothetical protein